MKTKKIVKISTEVVSEVFCNKCGDSLTFGSPINTTLPHLSVVNSWEYGSSFDWQEHSFDLCEACYVKITKSFKIKVDIREIMTDV